MSHFKSRLALLLIFVLSLSGYAHTQAMDKPVKIGLLIFNPQVFIDEMTSLGYIEGEDVTYEQLSFENVAPEDFVAEQQRQTQAMVDLPVDLLITQTDSSAVALRQLTPDIPIIFTVSDDPVATGAVADLISPGRNMTGIISSQPHLRRLQLLTEIDPSIKKVYYLYFAPTLESEVIYNQVRTLGEQLGVEVIGAPLYTLESGLAALENAPPDMDWLFLTPYLFFGPDFDAALLATSITHNAPIASYIAAPLPGCLINYGPDLDEVARQSARLADQVIRGANPGELPIVIAENGLTVNLEVAETLGMEIPVGVLRQADLIIYPGDSTAPSN